MLKWLKTIKKVSQIIWYSIIRYDLRRTVSKTYFLGVLNEEHRRLLVGYKNRAPFFYSRDLDAQSFIGIEWTILRVIAERNDLILEVESCNNGNHSFCTEK